jgi:ornithine cyclodeaminase/alanine dehydrogenase
LNTVQAFDINETNLGAYKGYVESLGLKAIPCKNQKEAIVDADVIITAGPIHNNPSREIEPSWLKEGVLAVPLDYDSYWKPEAIDGFDKFFVDDKRQILHYHEEGIFFRNIPKINGEFGEIATGEKEGRKSESEKIMCMNLGVAIEDMPIAAEIYRRAKKRRIGVWLPR